MVHITNDDGLHQEKVNVVSIWSLLFLSTYVFGYNHLVAQGNVRVGHALQAI
jgi:hypothetical protein